MRDVEPNKIINASAPTRICDNGGWTDTWFAEYGRIFNIAVHPHAHVQIEVWDRADQDEQVTIHAENYSDEYARDLGTSWQKHPLLEATIDRIGIPHDIAVRINLFSDAPPGASMGTSAAVTVALIGALDALTPGKLMPNEVALMAQKIETVDLEGQCGIQDQLAAAYGGINYIEMFDYPQATVMPLALSAETLWALENRLILIYLGTSHSSSQVHGQVIKGLEDAGPNEPRIEALRNTAAVARDALIAGDWKALGQSFQQNTEGQRGLHPALISADAQTIIDTAMTHGALGCKVNGAGGDGGSVAILCGHRSDVKRKMVREILAQNEQFRELPIRLSLTGLRVW